MSWDDLAHRDTQGLWGPGSHAPPQGSFAALRPRHQWPARKSCRRAFGLGNGAGKGSLNARQIKTNEETEGRRPRTETPIRSHCVSSHLSTHAQILTRIQVCSPRLAHSCALVSLCMHAHAFAS